MSPIFPAAVYALCFLTSLICAILLGRSYFKTRARLLFWSTLCFTFLALNNFLVVIDLVVLPTQVDLRLPRYAAAISGILTLLYGFIVDQED